MLGLACFGCAWVNLTVHVVFCICSMLHVYGAWCAVHGDPGLGLCILLLRREHEFSEFSLTLEGVELNSKNMMRNERLIFSMTFPLTDCKKLKRGKKRQKDARSKKLKTKSYSVCICPHAKLDLCNFRCFLEMFAFFRCRKYNPLFAGTAGNYQLKDYRALQKPGWNRERKRSGVTAHFSRAV